MSTLFLCDIQIFPGNFAGSNFPLFYRFFAYWKKFTYLRKSVQLLFMPARCVFVEKPCMHIYIVQIWKMCPFSGEKETREQTEFLKIEIRVRAGPTAWPNNRWPFRGFRHTNKQRNSGIFVTSESRFPRIWRWCWEFAGLPIAGFGEVPESLARELTFFYSK